MATSSATRVPPPIATFSLNSRAPLGTSGPRSVRTGLVSEFYRLRIPSLSQTSASEFLRRLEQVEVAESAERAADQRGVQVPVALLVLAVELEAALALPAAALGDLEPIEDLVVPALELALGHGALEDVGLDPALIRLAHDVLAVDVEAVARVERRGGRVRDPAAAIRFLVSGDVE